MIKVETEVDKSKSGICKVRYCNNLDYSTVEKYIENIENEKCQDKILENLKIIFKVLKKQVLELGVKPKAIPGQSHAKVNYLERETIHGTLKFETLYFTGDKFTGVHTHPEFVVDEVIEGSLKERNFEPCENDHYHFCGTTIREASDRVEVFCDDGFLHNVCAEDEGCFSASLSLGRNKVVMVPEEDLRDHQN